MPPEPKKKPFDLLRSDTPSESSMLDSLIDRVTPDSLNPSKILSNLRLPEKLEEALQGYFEPYGLKIEPGRVKDLYTEKERPVTRAHGDEVEVILLHIPEWIVGNANHVGSILEIQPALFEKTVRIISPGCDAAALALSDMLEDWGAHPRAERRIHAGFVAWAYLKELTAGKYNAAKVFKLDLEEVEIPAADPGDSAETEAQADPAKDRDRVFISYASKDDKWLERLQGHLEPLLNNLKKKRPELADEELVFDATKIEPGDKWREEIDLALARASVGVLLVSKAFLVSDFIDKYELLPILEAAREDGLKVLWVLLDVCNWEETEISEFQSVDKPVKPLEGMRPTKYENVLKKLSRLIVDELKKE